MKLSARNILKGKVKDITKGKTTATVKIAVGDSLVTASITMDALKELKLKKGETAYAIIKASDVIVGK
ncbi:transporter [Ferrovibrio terrae]|jgi:molybdopterin-binding protein|uniref:Transporter n=1 Tax=Ferrovibrio terrae TaxID=2594003 RepID=A0A516H3V0_9PROT|nr:TOBE domain-containing protein [Ferrovibrio terrae]QDO98454.1 transporter [Ferrovibrio terrae]